MEKQKLTANVLQVLIVGLLTVGMISSAIAEPCPVQYIQTDGLQYIDTGIKPDGTTILEMKVYAPKGAASGYLYGVAKTWVSKAFACWKVKDKNALSVIAGGGQATDNPVGGGPTYVVRQEPGALSCDGVRIASGLPTDFAAEDNLSLFGLYYQVDKSTSSLALAGWRIYYAKIWQNGELVRDFVPVVQDNAAGLYECIGRKFYGSGASSGGFTPGPTVEDCRIAQDGSVEFRTTVLAPADAVYSLNGMVHEGPADIWARVYSPMTLALSDSDGKPVIWEKKLPAGSRLDGDTLTWILAGGEKVILLDDESCNIDFIVTDGAQYIDTGIKPDGRTTLEMKVYAPKSSAASGYLYGVAKTWVSKAFACWKVKDQDTLSVIAGGDQATYLSVGGGPTYVVRQEPGALSCDGVRIASGLPTDFAAEDNLSLFGLYYQVDKSTSSLALAGWRIYYAKIWQNGELVRDFVPVVQDNAAGLYDLVEDKFYDGDGATGGFLPSVDVAISGIDRPQIAVPLTALVKGGSGYDFRWVRMGSSEVTVAESATYAPTTADLEHWLKAVALTNGIVVGERQFYFSRLPVVYLNTEQPIVDHDNYVTGTMRIQGNAEFAQQYDGALEVKGRGNSSWTSFAQKPYKLKLDKKTDLFGFGRQKHWVLISNFADNAFMRNRHGMELARTLGVAGMDMTWVAVVLNGRYYGVEMLAEHVRVDENRVDVFDWESKAEDVADALYDAVGAAAGWTKVDKSAIEEKMSSDFSWITTGEVAYGGAAYRLADYGLKEDWNLTGGYLYEMEDRYDAPSKFKTSQKGMRIQFSKPEFAQTDASMFAAAQKVWNDVEAAYLRVDHYSADGLKPLSELADIDSMVGYWLTLECLGNIDGLAAHSRFSYVDVAGKLIFGPVWDFDYGGGSIAVQDASVYGDARLPDHWAFKYWEAFNPGPDHSGAGFFAEWMDDPLFVAKAYGLYWHKVRPWFEAELTPGGGMDEKIAYLTEAGDAHDALYKTQYSRWGFNGAAGDVAKYRAYLTTRLMWLDQQFASLDTLMASVQSATGYAPCAYPYVKSGTLAFAVLGGYATNVVCDTDFAVPSADGTFTLQFETTESSVAKADVYLDGVKCQQVSVLDGCGEIILSTAGLLPAATNRFLVSVICRSASDTVVERSYATVQILDGSDRCVFEGPYPEGAKVTLAGPGTYTLSDADFGGPLTFVGNYPLILGLAGGTRNGASKIVAQGPLSLVGNGSLLLSGSNARLSAGGPIVLSGGTLELDAEDVESRISLILDKGAQLTLRSDAIIEDLVVRDSASVVRLNGHTLTIRARQHKNRKGWNVNAIVDARGGTIVWESRQGLIFMLR